MQIQTHPPQVLPQPPEPLLDLPEAFMILKKDAEKFAVEMVKLEKLRVATQDPERKEFYTRLRDNYLYLWRMALTERALHEPCLRALGAV